MAKDLAELTENVDYVGSNWHFLFVDIQAIEFKLWLVSFCLFINCFLFDMQEYHRGFHVKMIHISFTACSHMSVYIYAIHASMPVHTHTDV